MQNLYFNLFAVPKTLFGSILAKKIVFALKPLVIFSTGLIGVTQELQAAGTSEVTSFETMAYELIQGIEKKSSFKDRLLAHWDGNSRIAIWPLHKDISIPIPKKITQSWDDRLLEALLKHTKNKYQFYTRTDLNVLINEVKNMDVRFLNKNPIAAVVDNAKVDILIVGKILNEDGGVKLSYSALDMKGGILAITSKHLIPINIATIGAAVDSMTIDNAMVKAAQDLLKMIPHLSRIYTQGIRFAHTGIQTSFGRFISNRFTDEIQNKGHGYVEGDGIQVLEAGIDAKDIRRLGRGGIKLRDVDSVLAGNKKDEYLLSGSYWDMGRYVQIRLVLRNYKGEGRTINTRVHKTSIPPGLELTPKFDNRGDGDNHGYGPIGLELTSNRGFNPVFKVGEEMVLLLNTNTEAFITCFYHQSDGNTLKAFPNKFDPYSYIGKNMQIQLPTEKSPFSFVMSLPTGSEKVRCFGTNIDPEPFLPAELAQNEFKPIPSNIASELSAIFQNIPKVKVTEVVMNVTVNQ